MMKNTITACTLKISHQVSWLHKIVTILKILTLHIICNSDYTTQNISTGIQKMTI